MRGDSFNRQSSIAVYQKLLQLFRRAMITALLSIENAGIVGRMVAQTSSDPSLCRLNRGESQGDHTIGDVLDDNMVFSEHLGRRFIHTPGELAPLTPAAKGLAR